jgi:TRAP-type C4-dicarboxylate transport system permease small subunit
MKPSPSTATSVWARIDSAIYKGERVLVVAATALMTLAVFMAVVWRIFASPESRLLVWLCALIDVPVDDAQDSGLSLFSDCLGFGLWLTWVVLALRTAQKGKPWRSSLGFGLLIATATVAGAKLMVWWLPGGLVFSQRLALALLLWVVLLGSSMAAHTRRHLVLQAAQKLIHPAQSIPHAVVGLMMAGLFTLFLAYVGGVYAWANFMTWVESDGYAGTFESIAIPYWTVTLSFPIGFGLTFLRFTGQAVAIALGQMPPTPPSEDILAAQEADMQGETVND